MKTTRNKGTCPKNQKSQTGNSSLLERASSKEGGSEESGGWGPTRATASSKWGVPRQKVIFKKNEKEKSLREKFVGAAEREEETSALTKNDSTAKVKGEKSRKKGDKKGSNKKKEGGPRKTRSAGGKGGRG